MPTSGVTDNGDAVEIECRAFCDNHRQVIDPGSDVLQCFGPTPSGRTQASILQVPDCESTGGNVPRDRVEFVPAVRHPPKSAVKKTYHWWP
jgi:hypothetical protein